jgi:hypothetical protein
VSSRAWGYGEAPFCGEDGGRHLRHFMEYGPILADERRLFFSVFSVTQMVVAGFNRCGVCSILRYRAAGMVFRFQACREIEEERPTVEVEPRREDTRAGMRVTNAIVQGEFEKGVLLDLQVCDAKRRAVLSLARDFSQRTPYIVLPLSNWAAYRELRFSLRVSIIYMRRPYVS